MDDNGRITGTVQWFSRVKGYGFVRPDTQEEDIFVHYSSIQGEGYRNLDEGQRVEFTIEDTPKGPQAVNIVGLEASKEVTADSVELETEIQLSEEVTAGSIELETEVQLSEEITADSVEIETEVQLSEEVTAGSVEFETEVQLSEEVTADSIEFEAEAQLAETF